MLLDRTQGEPRRRRWQVVARRSGCRRRRRRRRRYITSSVAILVSSRLLVLHGYSIRILYPSRLCPTAMIEACSQLCSSAPARDPTTSVLTCLLLLHATLPAVRLCAGSHPTQYGIPTMRPGLVDTRKYCRYVIRSSRRTIAIHSSNQIAGMIVIVRSRLQYETQSSEATRRANRKVGWRHNPCRRQLWWLAGFDDLTTTYLLSSMYRSDRL
jgi:hypothetical protein